MEPRSEADRAIDIAEAAAVIRDLLESRGLLDARLEVYAALEGASEEDAYRATTMPPVPWRSGVVVDIRTGLVDTIPPAHASSRCGARVADPGAGGGTMRELTGSQMRALGLLRAMDVPGFSAALDEICWERDQLRKVAAAAADLLPWAENWLPDEAKDQGARAALAILRAALAKIDAYQRAEREAGR